MMVREPESRGALSLGLLCAGVLLLARHALLVGTGEGGELASWLLVGTLPDRLIESLILGVMACALAYRAPGISTLLFNALILSWAAAGLPRPDVGAAWPLALVLGLVLSGVISLAARARPALLEPYPVLVASALLGVGGPALLLGGAGTPTWEVNGRQVSPSLARPGAPSICLVVLDGVGAGRADPRTMPALGALARGGSYFKQAIAGRPTRAGALAVLLGEQASGEPTLAEGLAREGLVTALFGPPAMPRAEGYQAIDRTCATPDAVVERAAFWLRGVAGARFGLTLVIPTDAPGAADLRDSEGDESSAGLRAADRALGSMLAHLSAHSLGQTTIVAVVGTVEGQEPPSLRQAHLHVPLLVAGPGQPVGRMEEAVVEARGVVSSLAHWGGGGFGRDRLISPRGYARFEGESGELGVRRGGWTLWRSEKGSVQLFQVESDPGERVDMAAERPEVAEAMGALLDL